MKGWWLRRGSAGQFQHEKWFWAILMPLSVAWQVATPGLFNRVVSQAITQLSLYALVKGAGGQEQAARAKEVAGGEG